jgi:hypothetical protein
VLLLTAMIAIVVVPVGFALSVPRGSIGAPIHFGPADDVASTIPPPVTLVGSVDHPVIRSPFSSAPEVVRLIAVGALLFGLAAALRKDF